MLASTYHLLLHLGMKLCGEAMGQGRRRLTLPRRRLDPGVAGEAGHEDEAPQLRTPGVHKLFVYL